MIEKYKAGEYGLENETEGMYARTNNGIIGEVINSNSDEMINGPELLVNNKIYCIERDSIKDIKENIIDLIEVGDYVNENRVYKITSACIYFVGKAAQNKLTINIETILTKEQYEANCYIVEKEEE